MLVENVTSIVPNYEIESILAVNDLLVKLGSLTTKEGMTMLVPSLVEEFPKISASVRNVY